MAKDFNDPRVVESYDQHIRKLIPGYELIHLQAHAILKNMVAEQAEIVVVGCGTGYELAYLAAQFPQWHFCAIDPAPNMLQQAKAYLEGLQLADRIQFVLRDSTVLRDMPEQFDAALAILVAHFVPQQHKLDFFKDIANSLKPTGICLSYDLMQFQYPEQATVLKTMAQLTGLAEAQAIKMIARLDSDFHLVTLDELLALYQQAGFKNVQQYSQVLNYMGLFARK